MLHKCTTQQLHNWQSSIIDTVQMGNKACLEKQLVIGQKVQIKCYIMFTYNYKLFFNTLFSLFVVTSGKYIMAILIIQLQIHIMSEEVCVLQGSNRAHNNATEIRQHRQKHMLLWCNMQAFFLLICFLYKKYILCDI